MGQSLSKYKPWKTEANIGDGNCLFRCLSYIITGNQDSHLQIRTLIAKFIASEGSTKLGWYFHQKNTTQCEYLMNENLVYLESTWGGDVEIMAAAAILRADIYVANNFYRTGDLSINEIRWSLFRALKNENNKESLYITNFHEHYEPVKSMIKDTALEKPCLA